MIEIVAPGPLATLQDGGRLGYAHLGVGRAGAADRAALDRANRLVGNHPGAAGVEVTFGGLAVRLPDPTTIALTGAECPGGPGWNVAVTLPAGARFTLGVPAAGLRSYLAARGGIDVPAVLGSRSTDTLGGLGPPPLQPGDRLSVGSAVSGPVSGEVAAPPPPRTTLRVVLGPRADWFRRKAVTRLISTSWTVRPESSRAGVRLSGPALARKVTAELPSEPTGPGALQVPPDGMPILLGPDAPVTGGYPVIAVVCEADLDAAGQLRPGDEVQFSRL
jgi:biotin-dependent carboxylase-like uncharacterized protein